MKMVQKILCVVALCALTLNASAQFNWGVKAGFNASTIRGTEGDVSYRPGFHVGLMGEYMLTQNFGLESGLYYTTLGVNSDIKDAGDNYKVEINPSYLQLPLLATYKIGVGQNLSLNPFAGVYLGYGLGGKTKYIEGDEEEKENIFDKEGTDANRFDMGGSLGVNLQFSKFLIGLGYDYGFLKLNKEKIEDQKDKFNGNVKVSVGYFF